MASTLRTTFALDIPSDASPAFRVVVSSGAPSVKPGGLEWKVRLCLLVSVASTDSKAGEHGVRIKHLVRDSARGEWGMSWKASKGLAPAEQPSSLQDENGSVLTTQKAQSWTSFLSSTFLGSSEPLVRYHDGDEDDEDDELAAEGEWRELEAEMVECEVPIQVWPGNTAFKASSVVIEL